MVLSYALDHHKLQLEHGVVTDCCSQEMQQSERKTLGMKKLIAEHGPETLATPILTHVLTHVRFRCKTESEHLICHETGSWGQCHL